MGSVVRDFTPVPRRLLLRLVRYSFLPGERWIGTRCGSDFGSIPNTDYGLGFIVGPSPSICPYGATSTCSCSTRSPLQLIVLFKSYVENKIEKELR